MYLNVQGTGYHVADEEVQETCAPRSTPLEYEAVPAIEEAEAEDLGPPPPAAAAPAAGLKRGLREVAPRVRVEVEAGEGEDDVEELVLHGDEELAEGVEGHFTFVV